MNKEREADLAKMLWRSEEAAHRAKNVKALASKHFKTVQYVNELLNNPKIAKGKENEVSIGNVLFSLFAKEVNGCE